MIQTKNNVPGSMNRQKSEGRNEAKSRLSAAFSSVNIRDFTGPKMARHRRALARLGAPKSQTTPESESSKESATWSLSRCGM